MNGYAATLISCPMSALSVTHRIGAGRRNYFVKKSKIILDRVCTCPYTLIMASETSIELTGSFGNIRVWCGEQTVPLYRGECDICGEYSEHMTEWPVDVYGYDPATGGCTHFERQVMEYRCGSCQYAIVRCSMRWDPGRQNGSVKCSPTTWSATTRFSVATVKRLRWACNQEMLTTMPA